MKSAIYMIYNVANSKFYIGSALNLDARLASHVWYLINNSHYNRYLQSSWNKYGADNFKFYKLEACDKSELIIREQHYIDLLKPKYNLSPTAGNNLGVKYAETSKQKMSAWQIGRKMSDEAKQKMSNAAKGNKRCLGYKHPEQTKINMGAARLGQKRSEEVKRKISLAAIGNKSNTGRKLTEEHILKLRKPDKWPHSNNTCTCTECTVKRNATRKIARINKKNLLANLANCQIVNNAHV